ncbi:hypothetical protein [Roseomonas sp. BN140053]|uniref:hypothetical protein n=1 Tax=Roseomonas sp. BN140053 TaxID=3391898 RepID=UPI0039E84FD1
MAAILRLAGEVQEYPSGRRAALLQRVDALALELATWRMMGTDGANLTRDVLVALRAQVEDRGVIALRTPLPAAQPEGSARTEFLRQAVKAIELRQGMFWADAQGATWSSRGQE